ncbi:VPLPA-CTERM sorting domain-containing protein [Pseudodesulfovibrio portus]|uniref:VPLPA-CTERM sorting domain-containing protein n=1 Tax=Pseudodesulfovibrio portus TaxID=231439 RepID=A0ABN6RUX4_9BACT|nr:VPLPA-CTERM sorting domain-containing protein [Pseudodesulfovibrio portus]BDQ33468.1 hypothetical protein JCM14722_10100 [Pseudodesulfovibrio portus]
MRAYRLMILTASAVLLMSVSAFALPFPSTLDNFTSKDTSEYLSLNSIVPGTEGASPMNDVPGGLWDVSFAYEEAGHNNLWTAPTGEQLSNEGAWGATVSGVQLAGSSFYDVDDQELFSMADNNAVWIFTILNDFTVNGTTFLAGNLLIAFNDAWNGDSDYDDMILQASRAATPIPGAVWLLGTGLAGLIGLRRSRQ